MEWALDVCTRVCTLCLAVRSSGRKGNTPMWGSRAGGAGILRWCPPASGTLAWADRYGPVWRTGTRYNAAEASPSLAGTPTLAWNVAVAYGRLADTPLLGTRHRQVGTGVPSLPLYSIILSQTGRSSSPPVPTSESVVIHTLFFIFRSTKGSPHQSPPVPTSPHPVPTQSPP